MHITTSSSAIAREAAIFNAHTITRDVQSAINMIADAASTLREHAPRTLPVRQAVLNNIADLLDCLTDIVGDIQGTTNRDLDEQGAYPNAAFDLSEVEALLAEVRS